MSNLHENPGQAILDAQAAGQSLQGFLDERQVPPRVVPYIKLLWGKAIERPDEMREVAAVMEKQNAKSRSDESR